MGLIDLIRRTFAPAPAPGSGPAETRALTDAEWAGGLMLMDSIATYGNDAGITVTPETAMNAGAVYACVGLIVSDLSTLPVQVIDRRGERVEDHPVQRLLRNPNEYMTPASFWSAYLLNAMTWGNGYAAIMHRNAEPVEILPLKSRDTEVRRRRARVYYGTRFTKQVFRPDQILHTPYMAMDGLVGSSPIAHGSQAIATTIALERFAAKYFTNGTVGDILEIPHMNPEALKEFKRRWREEYEGLANAHRMAPIPGGKVHKRGYSPRDSQSVEAQSFALRQVARIYRVPIGKLDAEKSTYANLEAQQRDYAQSTLRPWVVPIEQELSRKLLREDEKDRLKIEFNLDAVVRASLADRTTADTALVNAGILTINEARAHHNRPPLPGGDKLLSPLNMTPAEGRSAAPAPGLGPRNDETRSEPETNVEETDPDSAAVRALTESIAAGIAVKEANAAKRALNKGDFEAWAHTWFADHAAHIAERLPTLDDAQAERLAVAARDRMITAHRERKLDALLDRWVMDRPKAFLASPPADEGAQEAA